MASIVTNEKMDWLTLSRVDGCSPPKYDPDSTICQQKACLVAHVFYNSIGWNVKRPFLFSFASILFALSCPFLLTKDGVSIRLFIVVNRVHGHGSPSSLHLLKSTGSLHAK